MQKLIQQALQSGVSITLSAKQSQRAGKLRASSDTFDCHGDTHDGKKVESMKGQIRGNKAALARRNLDFIGTFDETELEELEVAARVARAKLIEQRQQASQA